MAAAADFNEAAGPVGPEARGREQGTSVPGVVGVVERYVRFPS